MDYVEDTFDMLDCYEKDERMKNAVKEAVKEAVAKMHNEGFVHGDLRDVNILYRCMGNSTDVIFVDWDWAGKDGVALYPLTMNPDIPRHVQAKADGPICKSHDLYMVEQIFR